MLCVMRARAQSGFTTLRGQSRNMKTLFLQQLYRPFPLGPSRIWKIVRLTRTGLDMTKRRLREGVAFSRFLRAREA